MKDIMKKLDEKGIIIPQMKGEYIIDNSISDIINAPLFIEEWNESFNKFINNLSAADIVELKNNVINSIHAYISNLKFCRKIYCMLDTNSEIRNTINFIESLLLENIDIILSILINQ